MADDLALSPGREPAELITALRHDLLRATDRAVGAEAQLEHLQRQVAKLTTDAEQTKANVRKLIAERDKLRKNLDAIHASATWRIGRLVVGPVAGLKRGRARG